MRYTTDYWDRYIDIMRQGTIELIGKNIILRRFRPEDIPVIHRELGCNPAMTKYTGWNPYATEESAAEMINGIIEGYDNHEAEPDYSWIIEADGSAAGTIGAYDYDSQDNSIEIGYSIFQSRWGRGYGREALGLVTDYLLNEEGIDCLKAWTAADNTGSRKVLLRNGFARIETEKDAITVKGRRYDQHIFTRRLPDQHQLEYFDIEGLYGGNQEIFKDFWMRIGGCAAVTACDVAIYCDLYCGTHLYPFDLSHMTRASYEDFAMIMKPYIRPRRSGVDKLHLYTDGFGKYLRDADCNSIYTEEYDGHHTAEAASEVMKARIDSGMPIAYLNLEHHNKELKDFFWHWFIINGYDERDGKLMVKAVSYGEFLWLDFHDLWNNEMPRTGGMILFKVRGEDTQFDNVCGGKPDCGTL